MCQVWQPLALLLLLLGISEGGGNTGRLLSASKRLSTKELDPLSSQLDVSEENRQRRWREKYKAQADNDISRTALQDQSSSLSTSAQLSQAQAGLVDGLAGELEQSEAVSEMQLYGDSSAAAAAETRYQQQGKPRPRSKPGGMRGGSLLRGQLEEQHRIKGSTLPQSASGAGSLISKGISTVATAIYNAGTQGAKAAVHRSAGSIVQASAEHDLTVSSTTDFDETDYSEGDGLSNWWSMGSHWQPPVKPFVVKKDLRTPGTRQDGKGTLEDLKSYLPGMKSKPSIPKIFHQVYLDGSEALLRAEEASAGSPERWPSVKAEWRQACRDLHPGWEFWLWNMTAMEHFLEEQYPWFLPTFRAYPQQIHRVDAVRPFIMHAYGGVYIDLDTECLQPVGPFLEDQELVFQEEDFGEKSLVNSAIAGVPGLYFWEVWQQTIFTRSEVHAVLNATGPWALRAAFQQFSRDHGLLHYSYIGAWRINNTEVMVYPLGTWFVPCLWDNVRCHMTVEQLAAEHRLPIWLAGHHKNAGSWFKAAGFSRVKSRWTAYLLALLILLATGVLVTTILLRRYRRQAALWEHARLQPVSGKPRRANILRGPKRED